MLDTSLRENIAVLSAMNQHLEAKNVPPIELSTFDENPTCGPRFIENFKIMVHFKTTFHDAIRMERLFIVFRGESKTSVEPIRTRTKELSNVYQITYAKHCAYTLGK